MKTRGQFLWLLLVAMVSGLAGGVISDRLVMAKDGGRIVIEAHEFRVLGSGGSTRAVLGGGDENPGLVLYSDEGDRRAGLVLSAQGPVLSLEGRGGEGNVSLGTYKDRGGSLRINQQGGGYAELAYSTITAPRGYPRKMDTFLVLYDKKGVVSWWRP